MTQINVKGDQARVMECLKHIKGVLAVDRKHDASLSDGGDVYLVHSRIDADVREEISRTIVMGGFGLHEMRPYTLSLEDIFLTLTDEVKDERGHWN